MTPPFEAGDLCLLLDPRGRRYLIDVKPGQTFQYHGGYLRHEAIVGVNPGTVVRSSSGARIAVLRPRLADYILKMRRGAQVIYPKDIGPILHWTDIRPGHLVVEAGTGSGALTLALLGAVGPSGKVVSIEVRPDHMKHATGAIRRFLGELPENLTLLEGRVEELLPSWKPDRIVLDLPEPWEVAVAAGDALADGGVLCAYLPTVPQVQRLHDALRRTNRFVAMETFEMLIRNWKIDGRSVRPESVMVGHTGFLTIAHHAAEGLSPESSDPAEAGSREEENDSDGINSVGL
ncbi:MAG: tRNA (adenine-N1)-methyltransferase [Actinomycetota bacterium]